MNWTTRCRSGAGSDQFLEHHDYRSVSPGSLGLNRGPAHRGPLCGRNHRLRREQLRLAAGRDRRVGHDHPLPAQGARRQLDQGDRAARRQPRRIGDRLRRDLARGRADPRGEAGDRVDVGRRRLGRVLHRDAGAQDRRRAGDADRLDRRRDGEVRHRRDAEEARHEHGGSEPGPLRRTSIRPSVRSPQKNGRSSRSRCRRPTTRSSRRPRPGATRRRRRSTPWPRAGSGPAARRSRSALSTSSAVSIGPWRIAKEHARIAATCEVELVIYPPKRSLYESLADPFGTLERSALCGAPRSERPPRLTDDHRPAARLPTGRAARDHAERVCEIRQLPTSTPTPGESPKHRGHSYCNRRCPVHPLVRATRPGAGSRGPPLQEIPPRSFSVMRTIDGRPRLYQIGVLAPCSSTGWAGSTSTSAGPRRAAAGDGSGDPGAL